MSNSIYVISPYKYNGIWVFDDERVNLVREAFVAGIDDMLDILTRKLKSPELGFNLLFSDSPFPGYDTELVWIQAEVDLTYGGNWYLSKELNIEGWLCPALYLYYPKAPKNIFIKVKELK